MEGGDRGKGQSSEKNLIVGWNPGSSVGITRWKQTKMLIKSSV